jgi:hypothetical protein
VQAAFLNYLSGFALASTEYTNFTVANVRLPLALSDAAASQAQYATWSDKVSAANGGADIDLISPRGEKAYDERVRAWRLKRIQKFTHSHVKWAMGDKKGGVGAGKEGEDQHVEGENADAERHQVGVLWLPSFWHSSDRTCVVQYMRLNTACPAYA